MSKLFYGNDSFQKIDQALQKLYQHKNPYTISKDFMKSQKGASSLHVYGETPLSVFHQMFQKGDLKFSDCFVDLGCGRGRGVLFASSIWQCKSIGVDWIPVFCEGAQKIASSFKIQSQFQCEELSFFDLSQGSFFYFYALCMEEKDLVFMTSRLEEIKPGSKVITVSFPLTDYSSSFSLCTSWEAKFPWGLGEVFLQIKNPD